jgi:hypothetical protein
MKQRRLENRDRCADVIKMAWTPEQEFPRKDLAMLGNISPSGACLEIEEPIPVNAVVELEFGMDQCQAVVKYCKYDKVNYIFGVQFKAGYRWSSNHWEPKHLIQVQCDC